MNTEAKNAEPVPDASPMNLGERVRAFRMQAKMTLSELSERSGVSVSTLSKIENGKNSGTINSMFKIARGLGVLFDQLLEAPGKPAAASARRTITRGSDAQRLPTELYDYHVYAAELLGRRMVPLVMDVKTRQIPPLVDWSTHEGEEFILVLSGCLAMHSEHYAPVVLEPGDSVYFDSLMRHAFVAQGAAATRMLSVSLPPQRPTGGAGYPPRPSIPLLEEHNPLVESRPRYPARE